MSYPIPNKSQLPKVFGIGMFKTGTTSLGEAFRQLGYATDPRYHPIAPKLADMFDLSGKVFHPFRDSIREIADQRQAFCDALWMFIYRQVDMWYPDSRFVLTIRDPSEVAASDIAMWERQKLFDRWQRETRLPAPSFEAFKDRYREHKRNVELYFATRPEALLLLDVTTAENPWKELCKFLGVPEPDMAFPHLNRGKPE